MTIGLQGQNATTDPCWWPLKVTQVVLTQVKQKKCKNTPKVKNKNPVYYHCGHQENKFDYICILHQISNVELPELI